MFGFAFASSSACAFRLGGSRALSSICGRPAVALTRRAAIVPGGISTGAVQMHLKEGAAVPSVTFKTRERIPELVAKGEENPFDWVDKTSEDYFKGKRVVLFALPGAFTPTCSSTHVPGFEAKYDEIRGYGIDEIYCLSVNDAFVMRQWGIKQGAEKVKLIPDGACLFTRGMGMSCTWDSERGFGERSWRYSMVVNDGKIEKMFVEQPFVQNSGPDPFEVSDVDTMLAYLKTAPVPASK